MALFSMFEPCRARTVRMSTLRSGRRRRTSRGRSATSRALKEIQRKTSDGWLFFLCSSPAGFERFECLRSTPVVAVERPPDVLRRLILALMKWLWILPGLCCPYSRCQFPGGGSCPSDCWQYGQRSSRQTHARYMESIQEFPYTVLQRRETSPLKNACRKQAGYFLCIASAPSLCQNKERIVAIKKLLCNHFT